jgi:glycosyltransferase involved in cell wall biosynthesis
VRLAEYDVLNAHGDDWFLWGCRRPRHVHTFHGSCLAEALHAHGVVNKLRLAALAACEYNSLLLADDLVAVSRNTRRYIPGIRHVIPCGVDTDDFRPGGRKSDAPSILFVGTMHGRKRGAMLVEMFDRHIRPKIPAAQLWCVCQCPPGQPPVPGVRWTGRVDHRTLIELYQRAWVFCLPSSYEGFGVPYVEAMACGLAVVASPNPGAREVTHEGRYGRLVDDAALPQTLVQLLSDSALRGRIAEAGFNRSRAFAWDEICRRYEQVYWPSAALPPLSAVDAPVP